MKRSDVILLVLLVVGIVLLALKWDIPLEQQMYSIVHGVLFPFVVPK